MRQILLFVAPLCLAACSIQNTSEDRNPKSTTEFIEGYRHSLTLRQMAGSAATLDQVKYIAGHYIYNGSKQEFVNVTTMGYNPSLREGYDQKGNLTVTLEAGGNGGALFIFDQKNRLREALPIDSPAADQYRIIDGRKATRRS